MNAAVLLGMSLALGAPALKELPKKDSPIVGEWKVEQMTVGGQPSEKVSAMRWLFAVDSVLTIYFDDRPAATHHFVSNPKADPATVDLNSDNQPFLTYRCVFKLEADTLTLHVGWADGSRPAGFECPAGCKSTLYVFRRVKPKD